MVAEERDRAVGAGELDHAMAVGPTVHEITQENEPVVRLELKERKEFGKFLVAAVDVADGDEASVHAV
jgi:hypothetical protein